MPLYNTFWSRDRGFIWLLVIMVLTIVATQFSVGDEWTEPLIVRLSFFLFTIIAIASSVFSPRAKLTGYLIAVALFVFAVFFGDVKLPVVIYLHGILVTAYMSLMFVLVVSQIMRGGSVTARKILGGVAAYILIGHLWSSLYVTIYQLNPSAFQTSAGAIPAHESLKQLSYFSFVTLTTIGYGDITAVTPVARSLVIIEGLLGQLFPAIFIAKLVSLQLDNPQKKEEGIDS